MREHWFDKLSKSATKISDRRSMLRMTAGYVTSFATMTMGTSSSTQGQVLPGGLVANRVTGRAFKVMLGLAENHPNSLILRNNKLSLGLKQRGRARGYEMTRGDEAVRMIVETFYGKKEQSDITAKQIWVGSLLADNNINETVIDRYEDVEGFATQVQFVLDGEVRSTQVGATGISEACEDICEATANGNIAKVPCQEAALLFYGLKAALNPSSALSDLISGNFADNPLCNTLDGACNTARCIANDPGGCLPDVNGNPRLNCGTPTFAGGVGCCAGYVGWQCCTNGGFFSGCCPFPGTICVDIGIGSGCRLVNL